LAVESPGYWTHERVVGINPKVVEVAEFAIGQNPFADRPLCQPNQGYQPYPGNKSIPENEL
jgi:hypothetical protein